MNYLVNPQSLVFNAKTIEGFATLAEGIPQWSLLELATDVVTEWTESWPEGQGFGNSDMTFMVKEFIDRALIDHGYEPYVTVFQPSLCVRLITDVVNNH